MKNLVILIGNAGSAPEIKTFDDGGKIARFNLATSESFTNATGDKIERTEWHTIVVKGKLAEVVEKYVEKGKKYYVEGKITTRKYLNSNSEEQYITEIIAREIKFL